MIESLAIATVLAIVFAMLFAPLGEWAVAHVNNVRLHVLLWTRVRQHHVRISCAAILQIAGDKTVLLARMFRRQEAFGPFGGAIKYAAAAELELAQLGFEPQVLENGTSHNIARDLRGHLPSESLPAFFRWFENGHHRESDAECIRRELREELLEIGLPALSAQVDQLEFRFVRRVIEGPEQRPGDSQWQVRLFYVHALNLEHQRTHDFRAALMAAADTNQHLCHATVRQVRLGRAHGNAIGQHAAYLVGSSRFRPEAAPFDK